MTLIRMLVQTVYGVGRLPGDEFDVADWQAKLWEKRGIATIIGSPATIPEEPVTVESVDDEPLVEETVEQPIAEPEPEPERDSAPLATYFADSTAPEVAAPKPKRQSKRVAKPRAEG